MNLLVLTILIFLPKNGNFAEAMFKEAMRIYPPVPFSIRYVVDDIVVNGATLKGGTYTTISPLFITMKGIGVISILIS